jgi:hypothetical protein
MTIKTKALAPSHENCQSHATQQPVYGHDHLSLNSQQSVY